MGVGQGPGDCRRVSGGRAEGFELTWVWGERREGWWVYLSFLLSCVIPDRTRRPPPRCLAWLG